MKKKEFLCTIGPSSLNKKTLCRLADLGVNLFRINLSHTKIEDLPDRINFIRECSSVPICLDTEGAQVRTGLLATGAKFLKENEELTINFNDSSSNINNIMLYPEFVANELIEGDLLSVDFDAAIIQITSIKGKKVYARVISSGLVGNSKAVTILRNIPLPAFTEKDKKAIEIGVKMGIDNFALSFANHSKDVEELRRMTKGKARIISKIESKKGFNNLSYIMAASDAILI